MDAAPQQLVRVVTTAGASYVHDGGPGSRWQQIRDGDALDSQGQDAPSPASPQSAEASLFQKTQPSSAVLHPFGAPSADAPFFGPADSTHPSTPLAAQAAPGQGASTLGAATQRQAIPCSGTTELRSKISQTSIHSSLWDDDALLADVLGDDPALLLPCGVAPATGSPLDAGFLAAAAAHYDHIQQAAAHLGFSAPELQLSPGNRGTGSRQGSAASISHKRGMSWDDVMQLMRGCSLEKLDGLDVALAGSWVEAAHAGGGPSSGTAGSSGLVLAPTGTQDGPNPPLTSPPATANSSPAGLTQPGRHSSSQLDLLRRVSLLRSQSTSWERLMHAVLDSPAAASMGIARTPGSSMEQRVLQTAAAAAAGQQEGAGGYPVVPVAAVRMGSVGSEVSPPVPCYVHTSAAGPLRPRSSFHRRGMSCDSVIPALDSPAGAPLATQISVEMLDQTSPGNQLGLSLVRRETYSLDLEFLLNECSPVDASNTAAVCGASVLVGPQLQVPAAVPGGPGSLVAAAQAAPHSAAVQAIAPGTGTGHAVGQQQSVGTVVPHSNSLSAAGPPLNDPFSLVGMQLQLWTTAHNAATAAHAPATGATASMLAPTTLPATASAPAAFSLPRDLPLGLGQLPAYLSTSVPTNTAAPQQPGANTSASPAGRPQTRPPTFLAARPPALLIPQEGPSQAQAQHPQAAACKQGQETVQHAPAAAAGTPVFPGPQARLQARVNCSTTPG